MIYFRIVRQHKNAFVMMDGRALHVIRGPIPPEELYLQLHHPKIYHFLQSVDEQLKRQLC